MFRIVLPLILLLVAHLLDAQDFRQGYIIKANGDSVAGFVAYRSDQKNELSCYFKLVATGEKVQYLPGELAAYGVVNDRRYETKTIPGDMGKDQIFAQAIVKGALDLYYYTGGYFVDSDSIVLLKVAPKEVVIDDKTYMSPGNRYIGILNYIMKDCKLSANRTKFVERDLVDLFEQYNRCKGVTGTTFKSTLPWTKYSVSLLGGADWSTIKLDEFKEYHFKTSQSAIGGLGIEVSAPRLNDKLLLSLEFWYVKKAFLGNTTEMSFGTSTVRSEESLSATYLKIPFGLRYNFDDATHTPYVKAGLAKYVQTSSTGQLVYESESNGVVYTERYDRPADWRSEWGLWMGVGYSRQFYSRLSGFAEIRMESVRGYSGPNLLSSGGTLNLIVGIRWN